MPVTRASGGCDVLVVRPVTGGNGSRRCCLGSEFKTLTTLPSREEVVFSVTYRVCLLFPFLVLGKS